MFIRAAFIALAVAATATATAATHGIDPAQPLAAALVGPHHGSAFFSGAAKKSSSLSTRTSPISTSTSSSASSSKVTLHWYTDSTCRRGETTVELVPNKCYYETPSLIGIEWFCAGHVVNARIFPPGDQTCSEVPIGKQVIIPGRCNGPFYEGMYLMGSCN